LLLGLGWHNFCSQALIEIKILFPRSLCDLLASQKVSKNYDGYLDCTSLLEVVFDPHRVNGTLGVKWFKSNYHQVAHYI